MVEPVMKQMKMENSRDAILRPLIKAIPFPIIIRICSGGPIILYYHIVNDKDVPHICNLYKHKGVEQFVDDLEFLLKNYSPIGLPDLIDWTKGKKSLTSNCFLLTFDDGFREIYDVIAPILSDKGIPAVFFISSAFLDNRELCYQHKESLLAEKIREGISGDSERQIKEILFEMGLPSSQISEDVLKIDYKRREALEEIAGVLLVDFHEYLNKNQPYLTSAQVKGLINQGFSIGGHSIDHPYYYTLSLDEQLEQTLASVTHIREKFGLNYGAFAFPHNDTGVSREFFVRLQDSRLVDITFGTGGMLDGKFQNHLQRVSLEKPLLSAKEILVWQYGRKIYNQLKLQMNSNL